MQKYKIVILGAGPAGLAFAQTLKQGGEYNFIVIEKESEAGGLCRSAIVDGSPFDIGGGHFLDVKRKKVNDFLFGFMPEEEWDLFDRDSRIDIGGDVIGHPFEANIWQLPIEEQVQYLKSIAVAGCNQGKEMPEAFVDWISWKLGDRIAQKYMLPYNSKMFGDNLNILGTYWLNKLPDVSFEETLLSCLQRKAYGTQPGHAQFYYPKNYGYGELWLRMADDMKEHVQYNATVTMLDFDKKQIKLNDGTLIQGEYIVTTIPWQSIEHMQGISSELEQKVKELKHTGVAISYVPKHLDTQAQWIYYPDENISYHRILVRENFCKGAKGYWTETNMSRYIKGDEITFCNEYAYPLNTVGKPKVMEELLSFAKQQGVIGLGRWGEHEHYNSDVTVERAMELAKGFVE